MGVREGPSGPWRIMDCRERLYREKLRHGGSEGWGWSRCGEGDVSGPGCKAREGKLGFNNAEEPELSPWNLEGCATFGVYADAPKISLKTLFREEAIIQLCPRSPHIC